MIMIRSAFDRYDRELLPTKSQNVYSISQKFSTDSWTQRVRDFHDLYNTFGTYKLPLEWVSKYKNDHPFAFSSKKIFLCMLSVQKCFQRVLEIKENMLHTHSTTWYAIEVFLMRFEINLEKL